MNAALMSWPRDALVRIERRWRGLVEVWIGIVEDVWVLETFGCGSVVIAKV